MLISVVRLAKWPVPVAPSPVSTFVSPDAPSGLPCERSAPPTVVSASSHTFPSIAVGGSRIVPSSAGTSFSTVTVKSLLEPARVPRFFVSPSTSITLIRVVKFRESIAVTPALFFSAVPVSPLASTWSSWSFRSKVHVPSLFTTSVKTIRPPAVAVSVSMVALVAVTA